MRHSDHDPRDLVECDLVKGLMRSHNMNIVQSALVAR